MSRNPKIILFDLMDTLVIDPYHRIAEEFLSASKRRLFFRWKSQAAFEEFERGEISEQEFFRAYYRPDMPHDVRRELPRPEKMKKRMFQSVRFVPGLEAIVRDLAGRDNVRLGIASNYSEWYAEIFKKRAEIEELFRYFFFSCEMGARKPAKEYYEIIEEALRRELPGLAAADVLFIDDREDNLAPARDRGWRAHLMRDAEGLQAALESFLA